MNVNSQNVDTPYFEVHINKDKTYYIQPLKNGQQSVDSLITLQNIERIVTENLTYSPHIIDEYSKLKESDRLIMLKEDSNLIKKNYAETVKNSSWLYNMAFNQEKYVNSATEIINAAVTEKIKAPENTLKELPLNNDITGTLSGYLSAKDIGNLKQANFSNQADLMEVKLAKEFGFVGADSDNVEAKKYLKEFFSEIKQLCQDKIIPEEHIVYKSDKKTIDIERTATNLQNLTLDEIFSVLSYEKKSDISNKIKQFIGSESYKMIPKQSDKLAETAKTYQFMRDSILYGQKNLVKFLLKNGFASNSSAEDQWDLFMTAVRMNDAESLKLLLEHSFEITSFDDCKTDALSLACNRSRPDLTIIKLLLDNGTDPNIVDANGDTPLGDIVKEGDVESIKLLLAHGAEIDGKSGVKLRTPLQIACLTMRQPNLEVIKCLLEKGADPNIPVNEKGDTILDRIGKNKKNTIQILESYGAKKGAKDS